jgi:flagellar biosynthesis/type III secretory pathway protein FliH
VSEDLTDQELKKLERVLGPHAEGFVMTVAERLRQEGEKKGREEGREEGRQEGRQEGELQGRARAILEAFETLQIVVPSDIRERILGCTDIELLKKWLRRAVVAKSAAEIFDV